MQKIVLMLLLFSMVAVAEARQPTVKQIVGKYERISVLPQDLQFKAKIDTGATNSSMHATDIDVYQQDGKRFVRFMTVDSDGKQAKIDLPLFREARIKRHGGESLSRAVVILGVCMGSVYKQVEVTLTDRSRFSYPFLIGASYLEGAFLVDVQSEYMQKASCNSTS